MLRVRCDNGVDFDVGLSGFCQDVSRTFVCAGTDAPQTYPHVPSPYHIKSMRYDYAASLPGGCFVEIGEPSGVCSQEVLELRERLGELPRDADDVAKAEYNSAYATSLLNIHPTGIPGVILWANAFVTFVTAQNVRKFFAEADALAAGGTERDAAVDRLAGTLDLEDAIDDYDCAEGFEDEPCDHELNLTATYLAWKDAER